MYDNAAALIAENGGDDSRGNIMAKSSRYMKAKRIEDDAIRKCENVDDSGHHLIRFIKDWQKAHKGDTLFVDSWQAYYLLNNKVAEILK